nr:MAG TPA_asm: hypothetical protein [Bacteriophage sp.]
MLILYRQLFYFPQKNILKSVDIIRNACYNKDS